MALNVLGTMQEEPREIAARELTELGMEINEANLETVLELMETPQIPEEMAVIFTPEVLGNDRLLLEAMTTHGITRITHTEGITVWDHTKKAIQSLDELGLQAQEAQALKYIILHHDIGKAAVWNKPQNQEKTAERLAAGRVQQSMIGHAETRIDIAEARLAANGYTGEPLEDMVKVIRYHMHTSLETMDQVNLARFVQSLSDEGARAERILRLLVMFLNIDGRATENVALEDGQLRRQANDLKANMAIETVWARYQEGKQILIERAERERMNALTDQLFAPKSGLVAYLKMHGINPGPEFGKVRRKIEEILAQHADDAPEQLRALIDAMLSQEQ